MQLNFETLSLFVCHFNAPRPDADKAYMIREAEARAVRKIVENCFAEPEKARCMILGDFNEPTIEREVGSSALESLKGSFAEDILDRLTRGTDWTCEVPDTHVHSRPDRIFLSLRLAREYPDAVPQIVRTGMATSLSDAKTLKKDKPPPSDANDHAIVYVDLPRF